MGLNHRKLLLTEINSNVDCFFPLYCNPIVNKKGFCVESCFKECPDICKTIIVYVPNELSPPYEPYFFPPSPPPPAPPLPRPVQNDYQPASEQKHLIETSMTITACMIGAALIVGIIFSLVRFFHRRNNSRRRRSTSFPILSDTQRDFLDEDRGPVLDHPIWYIHTVGLPQSVIEAITVCKYNENEGLIEGTDCSVCLSEFEENESLRLLPKCSHAFHIPCIDTWLRSHKNCPLCRAPIVSDMATAIAQVRVPDSIASDSGLRDSIQVEDLENDGRAGGSGTSEVGVTDDENACAVPIEGSSDENTSKVLPNSIVAVGSCDPRALSDLTDNRRVSEDDTQPIRRSVSMDSVSALRIYHEMANVIPEQGSSNSQLECKVKNPNSGIVSKHGSSSSSLAKLMTSSSIRFSLQPGPKAMKRPISSSKKLFSSKHGRSLSSILPF